MRLQHGKGLAKSVCMNLRAVAVLVIPILVGFCAYASSPNPGATPTPTLLDQTLTVLHLKHTPKPANSANAAKVRHGMELTLTVDPTPFKLAETRQVKVTATLANRSKNFVHLNFPTTQRIEVLVKDAGGKVVNTWSEDQSFTNDPASVTINPGERLEYTVSVATREMTAGQTYTIEVSFPSYPDLIIQKKVTPVK